MKTVNLKSIIILLSMIIGLSNVFYVSAQVVKTSKKEYEKANKKRAKELEKMGYRPKGPGNIKIYLNEALNIEFEKDEEGNKKNKIVYVSAPGKTFEGALKSCEVNAKSSLAGQIETRVAELVKKSINDRIISERSAKEINNTVTAGKQIIAGTVSTEKVYVFYREMKDEGDGKTLIHVEYAASYNKKLAMISAEEFIRKEMEDETEELHKDLDKLFNL